MQVLDASVIYKWYADEDNSDKANKILEDYKSGKIEISIPDLLILELSNALKFNPKITSSEINEIIDNIYALELNIIIPTTELWTFSHSLMRFQINLLWVSTSYRN